MAKEAGQQTGSHSGGEDIAPEEESHETMSHASAVIHSPAKDKPRKKGTTIKSTLGSKVPLLLTVLPRQSQMDTLGKVPHALGGAKPKDGSDTHVGIDSECLGEILPSTYAKSMVSKPGQENAASVLFASNYPTKETLQVNSFGRLMPRTWFWEESL